MGGMLMDAPLDVFLDEVVFEEGAMDQAFAYLDELFGWLGESHDEDPEDQAVLAEDGGFERVAGRPTVNVFQHKVRHRTKGRSREKARRYRRENKNAIRRSHRRRSKAIARNPALKKKRNQRSRLRRRNPAKYKLRQGSVLTAPDICFLMGDRLDMGYVHNVSPMTGLVEYHRRFGNDFEFEALPVADFMASVVFLTDLDMEVMLELVEVELGPFAFAVEPELRLPSVWASAKLEGVDCSTEDFKGKCDKLVGKRELEDMSPSELGTVEQVLIQQFVYDEGALDFPHDEEEDPEDRPGYDRLEDPSDYAYIYGRVILPPGKESVERVSSLWMRRQASFYYDKPGHPGNDPDNWYDRGQGWTKKKRKRDEKEPVLQNSYPYGQVDNNPGSAKVIPEGHDFANRSERVMKQAALNWERLAPEKQSVLLQLLRSPVWRDYKDKRAKDTDVVRWLQGQGWGRLDERGFHALLEHAFTAKTAALISDIEGRTGGGVRERASGLSSKLKKVDTRNGILTFDVQGSKGAHTVKMKAVRKGNLRDINKLDVYVACSCPFWQWQGPEYHAKQGGYLYGKPRGTASKPEVRDPQNKHGACKHVLAVLARVKDIGAVRKEWGRKQGSSTEVVAVRFLLDRLTSGETRVLSAQRVAARYLGGDTPSREE
jgi:hypothetical protein